MVIRLVAHSDLLLLDLPPEFSIHLPARRDGGRHGIVLEDPAHVVQQAGDCQHDGWRMEVTLTFQEEQSVLVPLNGGATEPHHCLGLILGHSLSSQV